MKMRLVLAIAILKEILKTKNHDNLQFSYKKNSRAQMTEN